MREDLIAFMMACLHKNMSEALEVEEMPGKVARLQWEIKKMLIVEEEPKNYRSGLSAARISWSKPESKRRKIRTT